VPVELSSDLKQGSNYSRLLREDAVALMRLIEREHCELSVLLTGDHHMRQLNSYYRFRDKPTDVLSFVQMEAGKPEGFSLAEGEYRPPDSMFLGDVVISLETATRQAREMRLTVAQRLRTLLVHGVLHLLGYDHARKADAAVMFEYQDRLEKALEEAAGTAQQSGNPPR
jgi:rRNA maturation RNase YbeY